MRNKEKQKGQLKTKHRNNSTNKLWLDFKRTNSPALRERLIIQYLPLVEYLIERLTRTQLVYFPRPDLISSGRVGLIQAIDKFEPAQGVKFQTYAILRIRGAIIDELRELDWIPRSLRERKKDLDRTNDLLQVKLNRTPTRKELAIAFGITSHKLRQLQAKIFCSSPVSLDQPREDAEDKPRTESLVDVISSPITRESLELLEKNEQFNQIIIAIRKLSEKEKSIVWLYYYKELTLNEIGILFDKTESWASLLRSKAIKALKIIIAQSMKRRKIK